MGKRNIHGLYARNFPKAIREFVDQDYTGQLSPEEKEWLARFNDEFYGGKFRKGIKPLHTTQDDRRARWRELRSSRIDVFAQPILDHKEPPEPTTEAVSRNILQEALKAYRKAVKEGNERQIKRWRTRIRNTLHRGE